MLTYLGQINIARLKAPIDDPSIKDFVDNLNVINAIAEKSPGFIWRLKDDANNATSFNPYHDDRVIVNISVWKDMLSLRDFVYNSDHLQIFQRRKEWFLPMSEAHLALWKVTPDQMPDAEEGKARLDHLWANGPTDFAFDYKTWKQYIP